MAVAGSSMRSPNTVQESSTLLPETEPVATSPVLTVLVAVGALVSHARCRGGPRAAGASSDASVASVTIGTASRAGLPRRAGIVTADTHERPSASAAAPSPIPSLRGSGRGSAHTSGLYVAGSDGNRQGRLDLVLQARQSMIDPLALVLRRDQRARRVLHEPPPIRRDRAARAERGVDAEGCRGSDSTSPRSRPPWENDLACATTFLPLQSAQLKTDRRDDLGLGLLGQPGRHQSGVSPQQPAIDERHDGLSQSWTGEGWRKPHEPEPDPSCRLDVPHCRDNNVRHLATT